MRMVERMMRAMRAILLILSFACIALLAACSTKCYHEQFCQELIGQSAEQVIALVGEPTHVFEQGDVKILEWAYDGTYRVSRLVPGYQGPWVDRWGFFHPYYMAAPPYMVIETVPQVATLRFSFVKNHAVSYNSSFNGSGMCNYFVPQNYILRYRQEDRNRTY